MAERRREGHRRRPRNAAWWWRPRLYMANFRVPAPELTAPVYAERLRRDCTEAISADAVDLGTGDLFDRRVDADMRTDLARIDEEARRHTTRANRIMARHQVRKDKAGAKATDLGTDLAEEQTKLDLLDAQLTARREQPNQSSTVEEAPAEHAEETRRKRRALANLSSVGDSPFAAAFTWLTLIVLMGVDVPLLKAMLGQASGENPVVNWVLAGACAVVLTLIAHIAGELLLRYLDNRLHRDLVLSLGFFVVWLLGIGASAAFRIRNPIETTSDNTPPIQAGPAVADTASPATESTVGSAEITLSLLLTGLLLLTGAVALGITVLHHDPLQKQRRTSARRRIRLRWRLRLARHAENRHDKAVGVQQGVIKDIDELTRAAGDQIRWTAKGLIADVRRWMAVALGDPAATSALLAQPPTRFSADHEEETR